MKTTKKVAVTLFFKPNIERWNKMSEIKTLGSVIFNSMKECDNTHKYKRFDVVYYMKEVLM